MADPDATPSRRIVWQGELRSATGSFGRGEAIALAHAGGRDLAIVGGYGVADGSGAAGVVAVVDLSPLAENPRGAPQVLAWVGLQHGVGDILIQGTTAIVSSTSSYASANEGIAIIFKEHGNPFDFIHVRNERRSWIRT